MAASPLPNTFLFFVTALALSVLQYVLFCDGGATSNFVRKVEKAIDMPLHSDVFSVPPGFNAPQQVHITQGDHEGRAVIVSWVTMEEAGSKAVSYWKEGENKENKKVAMGRIRKRRHIDLE